MYHRVYKLLKIIKKSTHKMRVVNILYVDNVDNLFLKQVFADFYYISGTHCYQQVTVYTIF